MKDIDVNVFKSILIQMLQLKWKRYQRLVGLLWVCFQVSHLEDIVEQTGYVLEKDSEYSQKILEDEEEITVSVTQKGGKTLQHQVTSSARSAATQQ